MNRHECRISYQVLQAAINEDAEAIQKVIEHYEGYIKTISTSVMVDEFGNDQYVTDTYLIEVLKLHLVTAILKFDLNKE